MKSIVLTISMLATQILFAQYTRPDAVITNEREGAKIAVLGDSSKIAIGSQQSGWYPVTFQGLVRKTDMSSDSTLAAGTELLNQKKNVIGQIVMETKADYIQAEGRGLYKYYRVMMTGYIKGTSFNYRSIPERGIEKILEGRTVGKQEELEAYFKVMGFKKYETGDWTAWVYLDEPASLAEPTYRTIVLFKGETALYGVVSRNEQMTFEKVKDQREDNTGNYYFFQRPPERLWNEIRDIVYSFIPL